jgi:hypothetical protein
METEMFEAIRRSRDGSIDFDFYRGEAAELRRQVRRDVLCSAARATVMAAAPGFAMVIPQASEDAPRARFTALTPSLR